MTMLAFRSVNARLTAAYLATAYVRASDNHEAFPNCSPSNSLERVSAMFQAGFNGGPDHPYMGMWEEICQIYADQGWSNLCDAELQELRQKAMAIGFTAKDGLKVPATDIHAAIKQWSDNGWFRYEQRRDTRRKYARRGALIGLAIFGVPVTNA